MKKELAYYLTLYKIEGHTTWRAQLSHEKNGFDNQIKSQKEGRHPKITARRNVRIDRITGEVTKV